MKRFCTFFLILIALGCWISVADAQVVNIPDPNLVVVVRDALELSPNAAITREAMQRLTTLRASPWNVDELTGQYKRIGSISGLEHASNLEALYLEGNELNDLRPLARLTQLKALSINVKKISDLSRHVDLTQLEDLQLSGWFNRSRHKIPDLHLLSNLTQLTRLSVWSAQVKDLGFLKGLTQLRSLSLSSNQISDLRPLEGLTQLSELYLWNNQISDLKPLAGLTNLTWLSLGNNQIRDVSPLAKLTNLEYLWLKGNQIQNTAVLANLPNLRQVDFNIPPIISVRRDDGSSELPSVGQTLKYRVVIQNAWNVIGFNLSYIIPHKLVSVRSVGWFDNVEHTSRNKNRSGSLTASGLPTRRSLHNVAIFTFNATGAGEGHLEVGGKVTTTHGTVNLNTQFPLTIFPGDTSRPTTDVVVTLDPVPSGGSAVRIPDRQLAAAVRKALGLGANARITRQAMQGLTRLDARESQIKNLTGLEHATQLTGLFLYHNQIRDVSPLTGLTQLKELGLDGNQISNIHPLSGLTQLELLHIGGNQINNSGVRIFTKLKQLKGLSLSGNKISNIRPLAKLTKLEALWLSHNKIRDVSPLAGLLNLKTLHLDGNPIQDFSPLASLTNLSDVDFSSSEAGIGFTTAGPKIEGPWLWMIVSTGRKSGAAAAASGKDWLAAASRGSVTEAQIATNGAAVGDRFKNRKWTLGRLAPTGGDNITQTLHTIGLVRNRNIDNHVTYGSIALDSPRKQNTTMYAGSDDAVKVWLNGELVHDNPIDRPASDYQDSFSVTLKKGKNILLVAVYEAVGTWSGFFGFENDAVYSVLTTPVVQIGAAQRPPMYWINAQAGTLHRLVGAEVENLVPSVQNATSLVLNSADNKIYWTEQVGKNKGKIKRANLDGSSVRVLANILNGVPRSIAVDPTQGKLYWTNANGGIQRANLNGKQVRNLIQNLESPDKIIVDAAGGKLYWTETDGRIRRANLNGKRIEDIASGLSPVADIAISGKKLYWTEITSESGGRIGRANLNGSNFGTLANLQTPALGIAIDAVGKRLYWSDFAGNIRRSNLNGRRIQNVVLGLTFPIDLAVGSLRGRSAAAPGNNSLASSETAIPDTTGLLANYPNPFNPETWIPYQLATHTDVLILIYDARGILVRRLELGHQPAGTYTSKSHAAYWDGKNEVGESVASGVYFYVLTAGDFSATRKMLILK